MADPSLPLLLVFAPDLMDRSKIAAVAPGGVTVRRPEELPERAAPGATVVVDLSRPGVLDALPAVAAAGARVIGFASHVDRGVLDAARAAGCGEVLARSAFFGRLGALLGE